MAAGGIVTGSNLGPEFLADGAAGAAGEVSVRLGPGLTRNGITGEIEVDITTLTTEVDSAVISSAAVSGDSNEPNTILTLTSQRADNIAGLGSWSNAGNAMTYAGSPDHVEVNAHVTMENPAQNNGKARIAPVLELLRNGTVLARSMTGYQRHNNGTNDSSNGISFIDPTPGANPVYELRAQQGSNQNDVEPIDLGSMSAKAVHKVTVVTAVQLN